MVKETVEIGTKQPSLNAALRQGKGASVKATGTDLGAALRQKPAKGGSKAAAPLRTALKQ